MRIYRTDQFPLPLPDGHRFPAQKYQLLASAVAGIAGDSMETASAATPWELQQAHTPDYVAQVMDGSLPSRAWREIGLPWSPQLVARSCRSVGATIAAARCEKDLALRLLPVLAGYGRCRCVQVPALLLLPLRGRHCCH